MTCFLVLKAEVKLTANASSADNPESIILFNVTHLPTSFLTGNRPFGIVLTVLEMRLQLVQPQCSCAAKACIITADLKFGQHVAHDAGHRPEVS